MDMPVMNGKAAIAIRSILPGLKVIAASGSDALSASTVREELGVQAFLHKPFSADNLLQMVPRVLRGKETPV